MFHNSELYETEFGLGVRATIDMAPGDLVWVESEGARHTRAVIGDPALYARASEVSSRLKRFGFELPDRRMAVMGWVAPYVRGEIDHVPLRARPDNGDFFNHSCDPNCSWRDDFNLVARRVIHKGEPLTYDYCTEDAAEGGFDCRCGALCCRGRISADDWQRQDVRQAYGLHFKSHIRDLILCDGGNESGSESSALTLSDAESSSDGADKRDG